MAKKIHNSLFGTCVAENKKRVIHGSIKTGHTPSHPKPIPRLVHHYLNIIRQLCLRPNDLNQENVHGKQKRQKHATENVNRVGVVKVELGEKWSMHATSCTTKHPPDS